VKSFECHRIATTVAQRKIQIECSYRSVSQKEFVTR